MAKSGAGWGCFGVFVGAAILAAMIVGAVVIAGASSGPDVAPQSTPTPPVARNAPAPTPPAEITRAMYAEIQTGMSCDQVRKITGRDGVELSRNEFGDVETVMLSWENGGGGNMQIVFQNDRVVSKSQFGLR